ncbi:tRNA (cytosine(38)-C(5))-methyltransferase [Octopus sinensis]|uniref:tRNA (cytosine(38)-C(5))-methyltransferase n=1 Tax=Octopus sinensis TaxID=2607531 RepID=A0A6P7SKV2_9MOLL|nr:tRNA (cytosine(38)-C(5))-methyltransferase [Octopus sinensis]
MAMNNNTFRVLELYSGIGGMHFALQESNIPHEVVTAIDINPVANKIYSYNFPHTNLLETGIEGLTADWLDRLDFNMVLMSPPCQPFTRVGKRLDTKDSRTRSFLHFLDCLQKMKCPPSLMLLENVKGFEVSETRHLFLKTLKACNYKYQEFIFTPLQFGIPNSRSRYYLVAKKYPGKFYFDLTDELQEELPACSKQWLHHIEPSEDCGETTCLSQDKDINCLLTCKTEKEEIRDFLDYYNKYSTILHQEEFENGISYPNCKALKGFLETNQSKEYYDQFLMPEKYFSLFVILDIVCPHLRKSVCFTKRYGHYIEGAGSMIQMSTDGQSVKDAYDLKMKTQQLKNRKQWSEEEFDVVRKLKLRFFTPREIANLLCFPHTFDFPPETTLRQKYRVLGNSLNVHVVAVLIKLLNQDSNLML